ncbi:hypothetical protein OHV05_35680 (plasmid) [Kitasatospora sp. NBC_00070]|uniref:hypothetical protein n=1 Tax=Kitasatospora sp. NBC_00070 TaxID=2975962 RepID=UPI002F91A747
MPEKLARQVSASPTHHDLGFLDFLSDSTESNADLQARLQRERKKAEKMEATREEEEEKAAAVKEVEEITEADLSPAEKAMIEAALSSAKKEAIKALATYRMADDNNRHGDLCKEWFGENYAALRRIAQTFEKMGSVPDSCIKKYDSGGNEKLTSGAAAGKIFAYTQKDGKYQGIFLVDKFFKLSPEDQKWCILHEMAHWVDRSILDWPASSTPADVRDWVADPARKSISDQNAYCYQYFASNGVFVKGV